MSWDCRPIQWDFCVVVAFRTNPSLFPSCKQRHVLGLLLCERMCCIRHISAGVPPIVLKTSIDSENVAFAWVFL
eukprot:12893320-Prorocentrum_lima.AAC.1